MPAYDERTADSELWLKSDLESLISAVKQKWQQTAAPDVSFLVPVLMPPRGIDLIGQHCLDLPMNCLGDTQDTVEIHEFEP